jgi:hypothetical protein
MPPPAATQAAARLWTQPTPPFPARLSCSSNVAITRTLWWQTRFTRGRVREWKSGHNSVTVQNRTHVYMNFFDHEDLGNRLLQLCPKVVKHPVCSSRKDSRVTSRWTVVFVRHFREVISSLATKFTRKFGRVRYTGRRTCVSLYVIVACFAFQMVRAVHTDLHVKTRQQCNIRVEPSSLLCVHLSPKIAVLGCQDEEVTGWVIVSQRATVTQVALDLLTQLTAGQLCSATCTLLQV